MKIYVIAQIVNNNKTVGYRLLDTESKNLVKDYPIDAIKTVLSNPNTSDIIKNAKLVNGEITGTNGQLSRYAKVSAVNGMLIGASPLVVLNKIGDVGYTVSDFKGQVKKMKNSDAVEYAKTNGIANGKVIVQDNVEYISSISDSYEQINIAPSKLGTRGKVDLKIHIDGDAKSIAKHTEADLNTELHYNDVFSAMTPEQRAVLKQYYTWYTVDVYKSLAKNVRLNLAPGKAEKLAQLRGIDKWQFAGINDSVLENRFDAKCELGHNLRYEYFAIPEEAAEGSNARIKNWTRYARFDTTDGEQDDLRGRGAIIFGETCAGDFFNIAPEDMKKLVKTRKIMSEEIELTADIITNHMEELYMNKCKFLYECIRAFGDANKVVEIFGKQIAYTLLSFAKANIPFPKSLVILAGKQIRKNSKLFFKYLGSGCNNTIDKILEYDETNGTLAIVRDTLEYITDYTVEGDYQYNPLTDNDCTRRDVGAYNKDTRAKRSYELKRIFTGTALNEKDLASIDNINNLIKMIAKALEISRYFDDYFDKSEVLNSIYSKEIPNTTKKALTRLPRDLERLMENTETVSDEQLPYMNLFNSCITLNKTVSINGTFNRRLMTFIRNYRSPKYYNSFSELYTTFEEYCMRPTLDEFMANSIGVYERVLNKEKEKEIEAELNRPRRYEIKLKNESDSSKLFSSKPCIVVADRTKRELIESQLKGQYSGGETIEAYGSLPFYVIDIESVEEINDYKYVQLMHDVDRVIYEEKAKKRAEEEAAKKAELEKLIKEQEKARKDKFNSDETMQKLKQLLDTNKDDADYGIGIAKNILEREIPFDELSSKQQWRVLETIKQLGGSVDNQQDSSVPTKKKLADYPEIANKVEKLMSVLTSKDKDAIQKVNSASKLAFDIARTISYKGEFSDKQLKHINKAFDALQ